MNVRTTIGVGLLAVLAVLVPEGCTSTRHSIPPPSITEVATGTFPSPPPLEALGDPDVPLEVVHTSPRGSGNPSDTLITAAFNRRMVDPANPPKTAPLRFEPELSGRWFWLGDRIAAFEPESALPSAAHFTAWVPEGTASLDGRALADDALWAFSTVRPEVREAKPLQSPAPTDAHIALRFNQPVDLRSLTERMSLTANRKPVPFSLRYAGGSKTPISSIEVVRRRKLPAGATIELTLQSGIQGVEGLLPSENTFRHTFTTRSRLEIVSAGCTGGRFCDIEGDFAFELSNPLPPDAAKHITVTLEDGQTPTIEVEGRTIHVQARLQPGSTVSIELGVGLRDVFGQTLGKAWSRVFRAGDLAPSMALDARSVVLEPGTQSLAAQFINTPNIKLALARVPEDALADAWARLKAPGTPLPPALRGGVVSRTLPIGGKTNEPVERGLPIDGALSGGKGLLLARASASVRSARWMPYALEAAGLVQVTDLSIQAWIDAENLDVWVSRLSTAEPAAGVRVALRARNGALLWEGQSDKAGRARMPATFDGKRPTFAIATEGDDLAFLPLIGRGLDRQRRAPRRPEPLIGQLILDQPRHARGGIAHLTGILRHSDTRGVRLPKGKLAVTLQVVDGEERVQWRGETNVDNRGLFEAAIPMDGAPGKRTLLAEVPGIAEPLEIAFEVLDTNAPAITLTAHIPRPHQLSGDLFQADVQGIRKWGQPAGGARIRWRVIAGAAALDIPLDEGFSLGKPVDEAFEGVVASGEAVLNDQGQAKIEGTLKGLTGRGVHGLVFEVVSADGLSAAIADAWFHPSSALPAFESGPLPIAGQPFEARLIAVRPHGGLAGGVSLGAVLEGRQDGQWQRVASCSTTSASTPQSCELSPRQAGPHRLMIKSTDPQGRTTTRVHALDVAPDPKTRTSGTEALWLAFDKLRYAPGEQARVTIGSPLAIGRARLGISRGGVLDVRELGLIGAHKTVSVPITDAMAAGATVSVTVSKGRDKNGPPQTLYAERTLPIDARRSALSISMDNPPARLNAHQRANLTFRSSPGTALVVTVTDKPDKIDLTPLRAMAARPDAVVRDQRRSMANGQARAQQQGVAYRDAPRIRRRATPATQPGPAPWRAPGRTIAHQTTVRTNEKGLAVVSFEVPGALAGLTVSALGSGADGRLGTLTRRFEVDGPLALRAAAPSVLRTGDRVELRAAVHNPTETPQKTKVNLEVPEDGPLALRGETSRTLSIPPRATRWVSVTAQANQPGPVTAVWTTTGDLPERLEHTITIEEPQRTIRHTTSGIVTGALSRAIAPPSDALPEFGGLEITLGVGLSLELTEPRDMLAALPIGALETVLGRLMAVAAGDDGARDAVEGLFALQSANGGLSLTPGGPSDVRGTFAALFALGEARAALPDLPEAALDRALDFAEEALHKRRDPLDKTPLDLDALVLGASALASLDPGRVRLELDLTPLQAQRATMTPRTLALLTLALDARLKRSNNRGPALDAFAALVAHPDLLTPPKNAGRPVLADAFALLALMRIDPTHPLGAKLARRLFDGRRDGLWQSVREDAFALRAMSLYIGRQEGPGIGTLGRLWHDEAFIFEAPVRSGRTFSRTLPMRQLLDAGPSEIILSRSGGPLHYRLAMRHTPKAPARINAHSLGILRRAARPDGILMTDPIQLSEGDAILLHITVAAGQVGQHALLDIPIPSGFEARSVPGQTPFIPAGQAPGRLYFYAQTLPPGTSTHTIALRATLPGNWRLPPARVRLLSNTQHHARTADGGTWTVGR